jgi:hypothetical protein
VRRILALLVAISIPVPFSSSQAAEGPSPGGQDQHAHSHGGEEGSLPPDRPAKGLVYEGLRAGREDGPCDFGRGTGLLEIRQAGRVVGCTHGPDPAPSGIDVRDEVSTAELEQQAAATEEQSVPCVGDGVSGFRTQAIYGYPSAGLNRAKTVVPLIRNWAGSVLDAVFDASAAKTGGSRHVRFVTDPQTCRLDVDVVAMPANAVNGLGAMIAHLENLGYTATNRKFLVWMDANIYCGVAELYLDDDPTQGNLNNGHSAIPGMVARVDSQCWGRASGTPVEAHELMHNLGGVQNSAPHTTYIPSMSAGGHCRDDYDVMCYDDDGSGPVTLISPRPCTDPVNERLFDCNNDDYFHTSPPNASYLDQKWNAADNRFLETTDPPPPAPSPPPNDDFLTPEPLLGRSASASGTTLGASKESGEPNHAGQPGGSSVWYSWTATDSGPVTVHTEGSEIDSLLGVYTGAQVGSLTPVASSDDASVLDLTSRVTFGAVLGTTYRIAVDGYEGDVGEIAVNVASEVAPRDVGLVASRRRVQQGQRVRLQAVVDGCQSGDGVQLHGRGKTWSKSLSDVCDATFRVRMRRRTTFDATDVTTGARSPGLTIRVKR